MQSESPHAPEAEDVKQKAEALEAGKMRSGEKENPQQLIKQFHNIKRENGTPKRKTICGPLTRMTTLTGEDMDKKKGLMT